MVAALLSVSILLGGGLGRQSAADKADANAAARRKKKPEGLFSLVAAHGVRNDPVEFFVFWTFIPAFLHHGSGGDGWAGGEGGWVGGYDKHTRSTAADQPALLPDYKITWFWGGGCMISTPAQLLQMRLSPLRHSLAQPLAPGPWVIILFSLFVLRTFCCCVSRAHPAPLLTRGSRHFGRVIRSCWTLTLKFSLVVRLILSRILRHLLVRYLLEALCPGVGYLLHCRVFALPG